MEVELDVPATPRETWSEFFHDWREFVVEWMKCQEDHLFKVRASGRRGGSCQTCEVAMRCVFCCFEPGHAKCVQLGACRTGQLPC